MMFSLRSAHVPFQTKAYYGWFIVVIASLAIFFSGPGQTYSISLFINAYIEEFGWSRTFVSSIYSAATTTSGLLLFFIGRLVDRHGGRKMAIFVGIMMGIACLLNSIIMNPVMLFLGFFMIRYFGQGSLTLLPSTIVPQWFIKRRALAFSIMTIGGVTGSALLPPFNSWLIQTYSWNVAWRVWAILLFVIFVPLAGFFLRNRPEQVGLRPDGVVSEMGVEEASDKDTAPKKGKRHLPKALDPSLEEGEEESWTLAEAMKTRSFWLMIFCLAVPSMVNTGVLFHFISIMGEKGVGETNAALVLSTIALVAFPCTFLAGYVYDRAKIHHVMPINFMGHVISLLLLVFTRNVYIAIGYGVFRGILSGFDAITGNIVWPNYFGRKHLGSIRGFIMTIFVIASALGPIPFGLGYDLLGSYNQVLLIIALFPLAAVICSWLAKKPVKPAKPVKSSRPVPLS